jgi:aspartate racemase
MKHVGILAHSFEGATLCYNELCLEGTRRLGAHVHPEVTMTGVAMSAMLDAWARNDLASLRAMFMHDIDKLAAAGADFFVCPDNTAHLAFEHTGPEFALPCLHIADVVAAEAVRQGYRRIGILGTQWTMTGSVYPDAFGRSGLAWEIPTEEQRELIHRAIFDELCLGIFTEKSRRDFVEIIAALADRGCDAVALVCTEIPLLVTADLSPLPILDSTRLLAQAAVAVAIGEQGMPDWRGGPVGDETASAGLSLSSAG